RRGCPRGTRRGGILIYKETGSMTRFGLLVPHFGLEADQDLLVDGARLAESLGFDSLWVRGHLVFHPHGMEGTDRTFVEPFITLTYLAGVTDKIGLGAATLTRAGLVGRRDASRRAARRRFLRGLAPWSDHVPDVCRAHQEDPSDGRRAGQADDHDRRRTRDEHRHDDEVRCRSAQRPRPD